MHGSRRGYEHSRPKITFSRRSPAAPYVGLAIRKHRHGLTGMVLTLNVLMPPCGRSVCSRRPLMTVLEVPRRSEYEHQHASDGGLCFGLYTPRDIPQPRFRIAHEGPTRRVSSVLFRTLDDMTGENRAQRLILRSRPHPSSPGWGSTCAVSQLVVHWRFRSVACRWNCGDSRGRR